MNNDTRQIFALMAFTGLFAVIGETVRKGKGQNKPGTDVKIFLGVGMATVLLTLLAQAGGAGEDFAKGLAVIALVTSILVNGAPVFEGVSKLTGNVATIGTTTTPTSTTKGK
jgi:hypothetical protein